jgi:hypothetical protein
MGTSLTDNYLIDLEHAVIVDVEATTAIRPAEVTAAQTMFESSQMAAIMPPGVECWTVSQAFIPRQSA